MTKERSLLNCEIDEKEESESLDAESDAQLFFSLRKIQTNSRKKREKEETKSRGKNEKKYETMHISRDKSYRSASIDSIDSADV